MWGPLQIGVSPCTDTNGLTRNTSSALVPANQTYMARGGGDAHSSAAAAAAQAAIANGLDSATDPASSAAHSRPTGSGLIACPPQPAAGPLRRAPRRMYRAPAAGARPAAR